MTMTNEEEALLSSFQALRVADYERYQEILKSVKKWVDFEAATRQPPANIEKIIAFPGAVQE